MLHCELCGKKLEAGGDCEVCSTLETAEKISAVIEDTLRYLRGKPGTGDLESKVLIFKGNLKRVQGDYQAALGFYEEALKKTVTLTHECSRHCAMALAIKGEFKAAASALEKAVEIRPQYPDYRNDLGVVYFKDGQYDKALSEFQEAIRINPRYAKAHNNLAFAYRKKRMLQEAEQEIRKAIELDPAHAVGDYDLGLSYYDGGMFSKERSGRLALDAKSMGSLFAMQEKFSEALAYYQIALDLHPRYVDIHAAIAKVYKGLGEREKARQALIKALEINSNYEEAKKMLQDIDGA